MSTQMALSEPVEKVFFMVLFAGEVMREKASKICAYFGATLYNFPESADELTAMVAEVEQRIIESDEVLREKISVITRVRRLLYKFLDATTTERCRTEGEGASSSGARAAPAAGAARRCSPTRELQTWNFVPSLRR